MKIIINNGCDCDHCKEITKQQNRLAKLNKKYRKNKPSSLNELIETAANSVARLWE